MQAKYLLVLEKAKFNVLRDLETEFSHLISEVYAELVVAYI